MSLRFLSKVLPSLALGAAALFATVPATAAGDPVQGKQIAYTCLGCHGIESYKNVYPTFSVPKLRGQHPEYIVTALQGYARGERSHATMHAHAASLSDQDIQDIAAYLSGTPVVSVGTATVGTPPAIVASACKTCHGLDGVGIANIYPTIAGQHADYIEHALQGYRSGARKGPSAQLMAPFATQLKPEEIRQVAEYFSKQKPALKTLPMKESLTAAK